MATFNPSITQASPIEPTYIAIPLVGVLHCVCLLVLTWRASPEARDTAPLTKVVYGVWMILALSVVSLSAAAIAGHISSFWALLSLLELVHYGEVGRSQPPSQRYDCCDSAHISLVHGSRRAGMPALLADRLTCCSLCLVPSKSFLWITTSHHGVDMGIIIYNNSSYTTIIRISVSAKAKTGPLPHPSHGLPFGRPPCFLSNPF